MTLCPALFTITTHGFSGRLYQPLHLMAASQVRSPWKSLEDIWQHRNQLELTLRALGKGHIALIVTLPVSYFKLTRKPGSFSFSVF